MIVSDASKDDRTRDNDLVTGPLGIRFYAGIPLKVSTGESLGTLCVIDTVPRTITPSMIDDLEALAAQATSQLELRLKIAQLEQSQEEARVANELKSRFLANMSHEIRTPMTAIIGYADILKQTLDDGFDQSGLPNSVVAIHRNAQHLLVIINDILDLSKIEAGELDVEIRPTTPKTIVEQALATIQPSAQRKNIEVKVDCESTLPRFIQTDPTRLRQIVLNFLSNAVKFTAEGSVAVTVACDLERELLSIAVADTGIGLSDEQIQALSEFKAFHQADQSTTRQYGGTGLGLCVSNMLAEKLGGFIDIESTLGQGSVFSITVPTGPLAHPTANDLHQSVAHPSHKVDLTGLRILLAEDCEDSQRLIRHFLEQVGASIEIASNGRVAVDRILNSPDQPVFDVILMDMQMPELDGYEATQVLRNRGTTTPIIALTAHAMPTDRQRCLDAGCDTYCAKPIEREALISVCAQVANARSRRNAA